MKKARKWIAASSGILLTMMTIISMPVASLAKTVTDNSEVWFNYCIPFKEPVKTDIPLCVSVTAASDDFELSSTEGFFVDGDAMLAQMTEEEKEKNPQDVELLTNAWGAHVWVDGDIYEPGDTVTVSLPFSGTLTNLWFYNDEDSGSFEWEPESSTADSVTVRCTKETFYLECYIMFSKKSAEDKKENLSWFDPMKTQLAIAADTAATSGREAVAEASGDFALSYEIMKWLEDHPNVTLKYTLSYKGADHLIVIKGGRKLANPEIPWYGAEYLIANFQK